MEQPDTSVSRWFFWPAVAAFLIASVSVLIWIRQDKFLDREEAQHVIRAAQTSKAAFGPEASARKLLLVQADQPKAWYGWPYYLAAALSWKLRGYVSTDVGTAMNLVFLALAAFSAGALARRLAGPHAAVLAATFSFLLPGCLIWSHLFNPTIFLVGMTWAVCAALVASEGGTRWSVVVLAGILACVTTIAKVSTGFVWFPAALLALGEALRLRQWKRTAVGVALFLLAMVPAVVWGWLSREPLTEQAKVFSMLFSGLSAKAVAIAIARRWYDNLLLFHALAAAVGLLILAARSGHRRRALLIVFWILLPCLGTAILARGAITGRDHLIAALPAVLAASCGLALLGRKVAVAAAAFFVLLGCIFVPVNLFGVGISEKFKPAKTGILRSLPDDAHWAIRLVPHPDLVQPVIAFLDQGLPAMAGTRCSCLPQVSYFAETGKPLLYLDSGFVGPENITVRLSLEGRDPPWRFAFAPYPWSCGTYRAALSCVSAAVLSTGEPFPGYINAEAEAQTGRQQLAQWGRSGGETAPTGVLPGVRVRLPVDGGICRADGTVDVKLLEDGCPLPDHFVAAMKALAPGATAADVQRAKILVAQRKEFLGTAKGAPSANLGEIAIIQVLEMQLDAAHPG